ncbi:MAG: hypothetical protein HYY18_18350 [Planctomycetes bacterium]|nr:hypothetical protein [Planctomycetota bacterium]
MRIRFAPLLALVFAGCSAAPEHGRDFAEIWRMEFQFGAGVRGSARFGDGWSLDEGTEAGIRIGACYGDLDLAPRFDGGLLRVVSRIRGWTATRDTQGELADVEPPPPLKTPDSRNPDLHSNDIEAGVTFGPVGFTIGFSPGEFVDFFAGLAGIQLDRRRTLRWTGGDDGPGDPAPAKPRPPVKREPPPPTEERKPVVGSRDPAAGSK